MIKLLFKLILILITGYLIFLLYKIPNSIVISFSSYEIITNIQIMIISIIVLFILILAVIKFINKISNTLFQSSLTTIIENFNKTDPNTLIFLLKNHVNYKIIKKIMRIQFLIINKKDSKALKKITLLEKNLKLDSILNYMKYKIYQRNKGHSLVLLPYIKKGLQLNYNKEFFYKELFIVAYKNNLNEELIFLEKNINKVPFKDRNNKNRIHSLIKFLLAKSLIEKSQTKEAMLLLNHSIQLNPQFIDPYELLITLHNKENNQKQIKFLLSQLWEYIPSYKAIILWDRFYLESNYDKISSHISKISKKNLDTNLNNLLIAYFAIKHNKTLDAFELLDKSKDNNIKYILQLMLMKKENSFKNFEDILNKFTYDNNINSIETLVTNETS